MATSRKPEVKAIVSVDGEKVDYVSLEISQEMGAHHDFELLLDHKTVDPQFFNTPDKKLKLIHSKVIINLQHGDERGKAYVFSGLVTNVRMVASNGMHGGLLLVGKSTTIELERGRMMQSFSNTNLTAILQEITQGTLNLSTDIKPAWKHDIDFEIQHDESDWLFLSRLCKKYNERFYFSGLDLVVGPYPEWPVVPLIYDLELRSFEICSRLLPNKFSAYAYKRETHTMLRQDSPGSIEGAGNTLQQISKRSDRLTMDRKPNTPIPAYVADMGGLIDAAKSRKVAVGAEMFYVKGECKTCDVRIGRLVKMDMPKNMGGADVGLYRVYRCVHRLDEAGHYTCFFEGLPADLEYLPMPEIPLPVPYPIECEVYSNNDPLGLGRIKVTFPFDERPCATWIPVMTPNAGGNGSGLGPFNRGISFIPEVSDSVLVSFLDGQQFSQPVVIGSMFHGSNAVKLGGKVKNNLKTIRTRSGHLIQLDDADATLSITIIDPKDNYIFIDSANNDITINANRHVTINAAETMTLNARNLNINVRENMSTSVGNNQQTEVGNNKQVTVAETIEISAVNKNEKIDKNKTTNVGKKTTYSSGDIRMFSTESDVVIKSAAKALMQGAVDARISRG